MKIEDVGKAVGVGALFSAGTAAGAGLCALANKVHYLSLVKNSLPVAITGGVSATIVAGICQMEEKDCGADLKLLAAIAGIAATIWASPHFAKYLSVDRLSYIESAVLTAPGIGVIGTSVSGYQFVSDAFSGLKGRIQLGGDQAEKPQ